MKRREFLIASTSIGVTALAGCTSVLESSPPDEFEGVEPNPTQLPRPTLGDGSVSVGYYADIGCPGCHSFSNEIFPLLDEQYIQPDAIEYRYIDFVIMADEASLRLASAARAVQDETRTEENPNGDFFEYKHELMGMNDWDNEELGAVAENYDVDADVVIEAIEEGTYYPQLLADWERTDETGVSGTPGLTVENNLVDDPFDLDEISELIESEL